jgi:YfiH family protein
MDLLRSPLLAGTRHGFSTRLGGVSTGSYATLNLSTGWGDEAAAVAENRRRLATAGGFDGERLYLARQVHGAACAAVDGHTPQDLRQVEADALVTTTPGAAVGVLTADCVPILMSDGVGRVAAVHAGWRGTVARVAAAALEKLVSIGARRERVRVALGPSIGPCCFEVGEEVAAAFEPLAPASIVRGPGKPHVDLRRANREVLLGAGLLPEQIDAAPPCTYCERTRFFSYRRDGRGIGQMLSFIVGGVDSRMGAVVAPDNTARSGT